MSKAAGILGIIGGVFGLIAAVATLLLGGLGSAFNADGASSVVGFGWGGIAFSIASIVFGATAFSRPKGSGILLILTSVAGAILGGTFVAVCLVLSLIGGVLALFATRHAKPPIIESEQPAPSGKRKLLGWKLAVGALALVGLVLGLGNLATNNKRPVVASNAQQPVASRPGPLDELAAATPSSIRPDGELVELFSFGSKNTDIQRENALKDLKGQVVAWRLPVFEVKRRGDNYSVQTSSTRDYVGTFVTITPRNEDERRYIEGLTTGQMIAFRGVIKDTTMRNFNIAPAIIDVPPEQASRTSPQGNSAPASAAPAMPMQQGMRPQTTVVEEVDQLATVAGTLKSGGTIAFLNDTILTNERDAFVVWVGGGWPSSGSAKYALLGIESGGTACPTMFKLIDLTGSVTLSSAIGTCSDQPVATFDGEALRLDFPAFGSAPPEAYLYRGGRLQQISGR